MFRIRTLLAAFLAVAALGLLAGPASASAPTANAAKFCKSLNSIETKLKDTGSNAASLNRATLEKFADGLKAAGKQAPAKVKKAANNLASFYDGLASGDASAISGAKNFGTSFSTFFTYVGTNCND